MAADFKRLFAAAEKAETVVSHEEFRAPHQKREGPRSSSPGRSIWPSVSSVSEEATVPDSDRPGFSTSELLRRGWTRGLVDRLLGECDLIAPNPHHPGGASMRLYDRARVETAEAGDEFQAWIARPDRQPKSNRHSNVGSCLLAPTVGLRLHDFT